MDGAEHRFVFIEELLINVASIYIALGNLGEAFRFIERTNAILKNLLDSLYEKDMKDAKNSLQLIQSKLILV